MPTEKSAGLRDHLSRSLNVAFTPRWYVSKLVVPFSSGEAVATFCANIWF